MNDQNRVYIGKGESSQYLPLKLANRHGLIAGATGTGKTVTLQILAEGFSNHGVPVFMADVKGDLSGISQPGTSNPKLIERADTIGLDGYELQSFPTIFWDLAGKKGHPVRTTVSEMGPLLLSRLLNLNDTQEGVLNIAFKLADDDGMLLLDLKDLRSMLKFVGDNRRQITSEYGTVSNASIGAIQRRLLVLEQEGANRFFGEPALDIQDLMRVDQNGKGYINILAADKLMQFPRLYATSLLWLLSELFEDLPEVGDPEKPKLVFFFDEAHLLFKDAPKALLDKIEQVVRLIRSKGIGIFFVTQSPLDIPETVLGQLGNRVQHALRAFTPRDQKAVRSAAETFRPNPKFKAAEAITQLGVGEALVSTLSLKGIPGIVDRTLIRPPSSRMGPATAAERKMVMEASPFTARYNDTIDRRSAYEMLQEKASQVTEEKSATSEKTTRRSSNRQSVLESMAKSVARSVGSSLGRQIVRGILGSLFKGR